MYSQPTVGDFKAYFDRDFPYGTGMESVRDSDVLKAQIQAQGTINQDLFANQGLYTVGVNLLSAHLMVMNLRASSQGIAGKFDWATNSKNVAQVSSAFSIPQRILDNPELSIYASTVYGVQYLAMVIPMLVGAMFTGANNSISPNTSGLVGGPYGNIGPWATFSQCAQASTPAQTPDETPPALPPYPGSFTPAG